MGREERRERQRKLPNKRVKERLAKKRGRRRTKGEKEESGMKAEGGRRAQEGAGSGGEGRRRARTEDLESLTS